MTTTLIAMLMLFATTFGAFAGLYDDARDKVWTYIALRTLLLAASYGAAIAVFFRLAPSAWHPVLRIFAMWVTFYVLVTASCYFVCEPRPNRKP